MIQLPLIRCAVCGTPVASTTVEYNPCMMEWRIAVECHGQTEAMTMPDSILASFGNQIFNLEGVAFDRRQLEASS